MAGAITAQRDVFGISGALRKHVVEFNKAAQYGVPLTVRIEDLGAGADITARAAWKVPFAGFVTAAYAIHEAASVGVDGANTVVLTLRNITEGVDIATATLTATSAANDATTLTVTAANADTAAGDVLGIVVTQGATANLGIVVFTAWITPSDRIGNPAGTALSA